MQIEKVKNENELTYFVEGHIDTETSPMLEEEIKKDLNGVSCFNLDLKKVDYISSAGLRVILLTSKIMSKQGMMYIVNTPKNIRELFDLTGFSEVLNIE